MGVEEKKQIVLVLCDRCGGSRNHAVLKEHVEWWCDNEEAPFNGWREKTCYQVCKCLGCDAIRFRREYTDPTTCGPSGDNPLITIYAEQIAQRHRVNVRLAEIPVVGGIYAETVAAFNGDLLILAGAGLRVTVEAICKEKGMKGKDLQERIDALVTSKLLGKPQGDLLHAARYIGNVTLHEIERPPASEIASGLEIVEGLLNLIYILPPQATELRNARDICRKLT